jgi:hypothetical protein
MFQPNVSDRSRHQVRNPAWWALNIIGILTIGALGLLELDVPPGAVRTVLECAVVVLGFGLMLFWRRCNHARWM